MRKSVFILLAIVLCFALIVSCNDSPAGGGSEPEQTPDAPTDNMTDSYRNARKVFHDSTSIWLPELEGVEVADADIEITKTDYKPLINLSFAGNEELFNQLVALFTSVIGNPDSNMSNETFKFWEAEYIDGGQLYVGNTSVSLIGENKDKIAMHGHFFRGFTVTLNANPAAGGTVKIDQAGTDYGTTITSTEGSDIDLVATAADGYEFAGWFIGETKISDAATYHDYKVPSSNVVIEARFTQPEMTASYATGRDAVHDVTGIWILPLENIELLGSSDTDSSNMVVCFDIPAEKSTYELLAADIRTKIGRDPDDSSANHSTWLIDRNVGGQDYSGNMSIRHVTDDPGVGNAVYLNCVMTPLSPYYAKARARFHELTGVLLPPISDIATEDDASDLAEVDEWDLGEGGSGITFDIWGGASIADWNQIKDYLETAWGDASDNGSAYYWAVPSLTTWYFKLYYWNGSGDDIILNLEPNI